MERFTRKQIGQFPWVALQIEELSGSDAATEPSDGSGI